MKMSRQWIGVLGAAVIAAGTVTGVSALTAPARDHADAAATAKVSLTQRLDQLLADPVYSGSQVGLVVRDATTGATLYARNPNSRLLPASNMKLLTASTALQVLGSGFRFHTDVLATGSVSAGVLDGDLYLKGFGDPTLLQGDYQALAQQVKDAGITQVSGDLVADDSYFDRTPLGVFWSWDDEPYYYSAETSALTVAPNTDYDSGTVIVTSTPGAAVGDPVALGTSPETGVLTFSGTATTGAAGSANTLSIEREHGTNVVRVSGSVPLGAAVGREWVTVKQPTDYARDVFARALTSVGVSVAGGLDDGVTPAGARRVALDKSMTLGEIMVPFLKLSNNMHAEALAKTLGAVKAGEGTWSAGIYVIDDFLRSAGTDPSTQRIVDGSGLSRGDQISAQAVSNVLLKAKKASWFPVLYKALPIAGNPDRFVGGTLDYRMKGTPAQNNVHAKTGSLTAVTALSGYVTTADGKLLVFSMLSNNFVGDPEHVEDAVAETLAGYTTAGGAPAVAARTAATGVEQRSEWSKPGR